VLGIVTAEEGVKVDSCEAEETTWDAMPFSNEAAPPPRLLLVEKVQSRRRL
jgi:hypothetical protein